MVLVRKLIFNKREWSILQSICEQGYPKETCGLLLGKPADQNAGESKVSKVVPLRNVLAADPNRLDQLKQSRSIQLSPERMFREGRFEFVMDPQEHHDRLNEATKSGLDQIGLFHSHPDHPAVPSATDTSQPFLAGWSNVIVTVEKGAFKEAKSWFRESEDSSFQEEQILVE